MLAPRRINCPRRFAGRPRRGILAQCCSREPGVWWCDNLFQHTMRRVLRISTVHWSDRSLGGIGVRSKTRRIVTVHGVSFTLASTYLLAASADLRLVEAVQRR